MDKKDWNCLGESLGIIGVVIFLSSLFMAQFFAQSLENNLLLNHQLELKVMDEHKLVLEQMKYLEAERAARNTMVDKFSKKMSELKDAQDEGFDRILSRLNKGEQ